MNDLSLKVVSYTEAIAVIQAIRKTVFQIEQGVDAALEWDGQDEQADHIIAYLGEDAVGTARIRYLTGGVAKIERVAVLVPYRNRGIGKQIMEKAIAFLQAKDISVIKINAQTHVKLFYEKLGFCQAGDEFTEAGIPHVEMRLEK